MSNNSQKFIGKKERPPDELLKLKREGQARCRQDFETGKRTQENMFLISAEIQKLMKIEFKD